MNTVTKTQLLILTLSLSTLIACESTEKEPDSAFEIARQEKMTNHDTSNPAVISTEIVVKTETPLKEEVLTEWDKFKKETEKKILSNENKIKELSTKYSANSKLIKHLESLKEDNSKLRNSLDQFALEQKLKYENFKTQIEYDANALQIELKEINRNNTTTK